MKLLRRVLFSLSVLPLALIGTSSAYSTDEVCLDHVELLRGEALTSLHRIETELKNALWDFRSAQEMVYGPLWDAVLKKKAPYSSSQREEGEILYQRYRSLARSRFDLAQKSLDAVLREIETLATTLPREDACAASVYRENNSHDISQFNLCADIWNFEVEKLFQALHKLAADYQAQEIKFSELIESKLTDTVSDHDAFEDRYKDYFFEMDRKTQIRFLRLARDIRERYEQSFPGEKCCALCAKDQSSQWDPVLSQVKPDPQGDLGAAGHVVNNARLLPAFEKMKEEEKRKDREEQAD